MPRQAKPKVPGLGKQLTKLRLGLGTKKQPFTQRDLAEALDVDQSAVARWENWQNATGGPSTDVLVKFASFLATQPGNKYDDDCIWLLQMAKVLKPGSEASTDGIRGVLDRERSKKWEARRAQPGETIKVPLIEASATGAGDVEATWDIPAWLISDRDPASIICARSTWELFPFESGDILVIDRWANDPWELIQQGSLVAVHFTRYPERIRVDLSQRAIQRAATVVDLAELEKQHSIHRQFLEQHGSKEALQTFDADDAAAEELAKRWTPDEHGTIDLQHIQAGWLRLELAGYPDFAARSDPGRWPDETLPWRLGLQAASVAGVTSGGGVTVPLTPMTAAWEENSNWRDHPPIRLTGSRILGRVISQMRAAPKESMPGARSRKERT